MNKLKKIEKMYGKDKWSNDMAVVLAHLREMGYKSLADLLTPQEKQ